MNRRWNESQLNAAMPATTVAATLPGFVACSIAAIPSPTAQLWHALYQAAFSQAIKQLLIDVQPTAYQRLVYRVNVN
jgi:hypothetical protein